MRYSGRLLTDAIILTLATAGLEVGDGEAPEGVGWQTIAGQSQFFGYVVVHPIPGGVLDGTIDAPDADAWPIYQCSSYGANRAQCEFVADEARDVLLSTPITLSARTVAQVRVDMLGGARREDDIQPPIWQGVDRYRIFTTP